MNNEFVSLVLIDSDNHTIGTLDCKSPEQFRKDIEKWILSNKRYIEYGWLSKSIFNIAKNP